MTEEESAATRGTDGRIDVPTPEPREQGWRGPILAALLLLVLPSTPLLRIVVPVDQTLLLLAPALAACAVAGWRAGGRFPLALFWTLFAVWIVWQPGASAGAFELLSRGWAVMVAAVFAAIVMAGHGDRFLPRALLALAVAGALGTLMVLVASGGFDGARQILVDEVARRAAVSTAQWQEMTNTPEWEQFVEQTPNAVSLAEGVDRQLVALPIIARVLFPALLALESLAALALAWALYHRVGRARLGPPLARVREFRFDDALIWGVIAGLLCVVLQSAGPVMVTGANLLLFLGALYALRGLGVLMSILAPGRWMMVAYVIFTILFWHVVGVIAVAVGLGDTWFDWRRRLRPKKESQRSE